MSSNTNFPYFSELPAELRRRVWQLCIPSRRTVEVDMPPETEMLCDSRMCCRSPRDATVRNAAVPPFAQACREARKVALEEGGRLLLPSDQDVEGVPNQHSNAGFQNPWFWPGRDTVHLNWDPRCAGWYDMDELPVPFLLHCAEDAADCSVMSRLLGWLPLDDDPAGRGRVRRSRYQAKVLDQLEGRGACSVCLMTIIIHAPNNIVQGSGVFDGGASPIQLVPMSDLQTFSTMHRLWERSLDFEKRVTVDERTARQFRILLDHEWLAQRVARWQEDVRNVWLRHKYEAQYDSDQFLSVVRASAILLRGESLAETSVLSPTLVEGRGLKFDGFHPWVKAMTDAMPTFRPVVMFRHCALKCYNTGAHNLR